MKKSWLGVAGSAALVFGLFACSGEDGADGINGKDGQNGLNGVSCEVAALKSGNGYKVLCDGDSVGVLLNGADGEDGAKGDTGAAGKDGAKGDPGEKGSTGDDGTSCTVDTLAKQVGFKVLCDGDSVGVLLNGVPGESCTTSEADDGIAITCGSTTTVVKNGANGTSCTASVNEDGDFDLECDGKKVGTIKNGADGEPGANGTSCTASVNEDGDFDLECDGKKVGTIKNGENGEPGAAGASCTAVEKEDKSGFTLSCDGKVVGTILNGQNGISPEACTLVDNEDGTLTQTCGETSVVIYKALCGVTPYDPAKQFCVGVSLYNLCGSRVYDPSVQQCVEGKVMVSCGGELKEVGPDQKCSDDVVVTFCGMYEKDSIFYDSTKFFCENENVYVLCGGEKFDPKTEACDGNDKVLPRCGSIFVTDAYTEAVYCALAEGATCFGSTMSLSTNDVTYEWRNDSAFAPQTYDPETQICDTRDNNVYGFVKIGTGKNAQVWMSKNLNYADSTAMPNLVGQTECNSGDPDCSNLGRKYSWSAVMNYSSDKLAEITSSEENYYEPTADVQGICPDGWHVPTSNDYQILSTSVYGSQKALKSTDYPQGNASGGTNSSGFNALYTGTSEHPSYGYVSYFWTSTENSTASRAVALMLATDAEDIIRHSAVLGKTNKFSVRCIKNAE